VTRSPGSHFKAAISGPIFARDPSEAQRLNGMFFALCEEAPFVDERTLPRREDMQESKYYYFVVQGTTLYAEEDEAAPETFIAIHSGPIPEMFIENPMMIAPFLPGQCKDIASVQTVRLEHGLPPLGPGFRIYPFAIPELLFKVTMALEAVRLPPQ
jgi:hypothetical protein